MLSLVGPVSSTEMDYFVSTANSILEFKPIADLVPYVLGFFGGILVFKLLWRFFSHK